MSLCGKLRGAMHSKTKTNQVDFFLIWLYATRLYKPLFFQIRVVNEQGRIHGQYQSRTGGQGRKCVFSHIPTRSPRTDRWTDKASYRVACSRLKTQLSLTSFFIFMNDYNVDYICCDIKWLLKHVAVTTNNIFTW